jgi:hypothetical protein
MILEKSPDSFHEQPNLGAKEVVLAEKPREQSGEQKHISVL